MNAQKKFIVWDWNGTLIDDALVNVACFNAVLTAAGKKEIDLRVYQDTFEVPIVNFYVKNGFTEQEFFEGGSSLQDIYHRQYNERIVGVGFRDGAADMLHTTHAAGTGHIVLSNHLVSAIVPHLARLDAHRLFWDVLAHGDRSEQESWTPKGERLKTFMRHNGLRPENGIIVGDTPEETQIAKETGLVSVAITGGFASHARLEAAQPDHLLHSLHELKPILREKGFMS